jgi:hypothetical protein
MICVDETSYYYWTTFNTMSIDPLDFKEMEKMSTEIFERLKKQHIR